MTRVLHAALMTKFEPGVYQQMAWEKEAAVGRSWDVVIYTNLDREDPAGLFVKEDVPAKLRQTRLGRWFAIRRAYYRWLEGASREHDAVLVRYTAYDPLRPLGLRRLNGLVGSVHHTLEGPELASLGRSMRWRLIQRVEAIFGVLSIRSVDLLVSVTPEIAVYERRRSGSRAPVLVYPNGVMINSDPVEDNRGDVPELVFVASYFESWQGLDRLLASLPAASEEFILHIVGEVDEATIGECTDTRVRFHGTLGSSHLNELLTSAWVGLSSFALDRKGMTEACTLKVREYLSNGVPVFAGHQDTFPLEWKYFRKGPPNVEVIVEFARSVRNISRQEVVNASRPMIDKRSLVARAHAEVSRIVLECRS